MLRTARLLTIGAVCAATLVLATEAADASSYEVDLLCGGRRCPVTWQRGTRWVMGEYGQRYTIRIRNRTSRWTEAVITVDGRDAVNGSPGCYANRGYLIEPWGTIEVEGFRTSSTEVATFRFTTKRDSYAGRVDGGRNTGIVGVAFFPERRRRRWLPDWPIFKPRREERYGFDDDAGAESAPRTEADGSAAGKAPSAAPSERSADRAYKRRGRSRSRQNMGTQYGERRWSEVTEVDFVRANRSSPDRVITIRYDDRDGLISKGIDPPRPYLPPPPRPLPRAETRYTQPPPDPFPYR